MRSSSNAFFVNEQVTGISALLTSDYVYNDLSGKEITIYEGSSIFVDVKNGLAVYGESYFKVVPQDFTLSN